MNGVHPVDRIETENGHVLLQEDSEGRLYLTVAGTDTSGSARVAFVVLSPKEREALRRAVGKGFMDTGK